MNEPTVTLELDGGEAMNLHETEASQAEPRPGGMRFTYPSGARPLEGYTIKRGVGRGGFGEVYYGTSDGGKEVALKLIRRNLDVELRGVTQCLNLKHPNLVALYDIRRDELDDSWVIMEYVSGESLEQASAAHPSGMPVAEAMAWMQGICAGVAYLHDKGVVHRDLKPGNIFSDEGLVKIGDYGLSKFISASRRSGQTESVGTVHYMAPEVANGRYGKEIDIYALGVILYEMLTGRVPFEGESVGEVLMKHLTAAPDVSCLAEPFRGVVARALAKDPAQRYRTVAELMAALPLPTGGTVLLVSGRAPAPIRGESPFRPVRAAAGAAGAAAVAATAAAAAMPAVEMVEEEPIARAARDACRQMADGWNRAGFSTPTKVVLVLALAFAGLQFVPIIFPAALMAIVAYGVYRLTRALVLSIAGPRPHYAPRQPVHAPPQARPHGAQQPPPQRQAAPPTGWAERRRSHRLARHREQATPALLVATPRERFTQLLGSMLLAAGVSAAIAAVLGLVMRQTPLPEQLAWLAIVGTLGSWSIMLPAKLWEGRHGEPILRRFVLLLCGLGVGAAACYWADVLLVTLPWSPDFVGSGLLDGRPFAGRNVFDSSVQLTGVHGEPLLRGFLAYFAFLFPVLRWWRQADPLRPARLSLWSVVVVTVWAGLLSQFWPFPQPWGMMIAATVAIAVQLASPWHDPKQLAARPTRMVV